MHRRVRDLDVAYEEHGEGLPLVALHGIMLDRHSLRATLEPHFAGRDGWRRVYVDLPGHGETPGHDSIRTHDDVLEVVLELVDALVGDGRLVVAGHSYGALLARGLALRRANHVAGLLLAVPPVQGSPLPEFRVRHAEASFVEMLAADEQEKIGWIAWQTPDVLAAVRREVDAGIRCDRAFVDRLPQVPELASLAAERESAPEYPMLVVAARSDAWCGYEGAVGLLERYPRATLAVLDGAGHCAHLERPLLFEALVADWLDRVEASVGEPAPTDAR